MKGVVILALLLAIPLAYSISIRDLVARYSFSAAAVQMNLTDYTDFMVDRNNNGVNDTLVFELATNNAAGNFIFVINLFDRGGVLTNETNRTLSSGANRLNITFSSTLLEQTQFNYSIKVYNFSRRLKYRKDGILTQAYLNYEEGFRIIGIKDLKINKTLEINATINSPGNETHVATLFLSYNNSVIFSKGSKKFTSPTSHVVFDFDNETIKKTHFSGSYSLSSVKIGTKTIRTNFTTAFYDFRDFASTPYLSDFTDGGADKDGDGKYDFLQVNANIRAFNDGIYTVTLTLYDLFDNLIEAKNTSFFLSAGDSSMPFNFNGSRIYEKKINGPFVIKTAELFENGILADRINDAHTTLNYDFNDFDRPELPDLSVNISISDGYHYGISNITINFTFKNIGMKPAFGVSADIFDNRTFSIKNNYPVLNSNSQATYGIDFINISDFEVNAIADLQDIVEELNESNNAQRIAVKLNKKPSLTPINNITAKEAETITLNFSALDPNGDNLSFSVNLSKFSANSNIFQWNTTTTESGNYTLIATASDGFLNDTSAFRITILDDPEKDFDNDGIDDSVDNLIGDEKSVNASNIDLSIFLDDSGNLSKFFNRGSRVRFLDKNITIAEFDFNFSVHRLNLTNLAISRQAGNGTGFLIFRGLKMPEGATKTLYVDRTNPAVNGVCIREDEVSSINEISGSCNSNNEFPVECDGTQQSSYTCTYNSTLNKYRVQGLHHSGIIQLDYAKPAANSGASSNSGSGISGNSGGGGGGISGIGCVSSWQCSAWSECTGGFKNRKCTDAGKCGFSENKPDESQKCAENRKNLIDVLKPIEFIKGKIAANQNAQPKLPGITGQAVNQAYGKQAFGIFIVFAEAFVVIAVYFSIKKFRKRH